MQVTAVSVFPYGNNAASMSAPASGVQTAPPGPDATAEPTAPPNRPGTVAALPELPAQPASSTLASDGGAGTAILRENTGSGGIPAKMAAAIYSLNLSFDIQAQALDLLA